MNDKEMYYLISHISSVVDILKDNLSSLENLVYRGHERLWRELRLEEMEETKK